MISKAKSWFRVIGGGDAGTAVDSQPGEPSLAEVLLMFAAVLSLHLLLVCRVRNFWDARVPWFDCEEYLDIAAIIRQGDLLGHSMPQQFWGFPYAIAGISKLLVIPAPMALVLISILGSLAACILIHRLYGGWVAAAFIIIDYQWIVLSVEGGSEPLFVCLLYAAFLAVRSCRWNTAALLASLSTTVRPVGVLALLAFAAVLAGRKNWRQLAVITLIGLAVGILYVIPLWIILGNPFANFVAYRSHWGPQGWPLTYPFGAVAPSYLAAFHERRWTYFVFSVIWPMVALLGIVAMSLPRNRQRFWLHQSEALFSWMYVLFVITYNDKDIFLAFDRYLAPGLPLLLFAMRDWIPRDRRLLWGGAILAALLSAAEVVSFKNVFGFRLP